MSISSPKKRKEKTAESKERNRLLEILLVLGLGGVLAIFVNAFVFKMYQIPSDSMNDTLLKGDYTIASPLFHQPQNVQRGDIVVFRIPSEWAPDYTGELYIKRAVALGGDTVSSAGAGSPLMVNGVPIKEEYLKPGSDASEVAFSYKVPKGDMFVLGDNRGNSLDSRYHPESPFIQVSSVVNRPVALLWPVNRFNIFPNEEPAFKEAAAKNPIAY